MNRELDIKMYGPLTEDGDVKPTLGDTVAIIMENGRVRLLTLTGVTKTLDGMVLYASGGERVMLTDCYLLYTVDPTSVEVDS